MWPEFPLFPEAASTLAGQVDALYLVWVALASFFSLLIAVSILVLAVRYRRRAADEVGHPEKAGLWLEIAWSVIPLGILLVMFAWGAWVFFVAARPPADAIEYFVVGKQWMWKFQHPEGNREINQLHVPVERPIRLTMTSEDVIHSFFVPAFRVKQDVVPGRYTTVWFEATRTGTFRLHCAEYCGAEHSLMGGFVTVLAPRDYEAWLAGGGERGSPRRSMAASGEELFRALACHTCHRPDTPVRGPMLDGLFGSTVTLASGETVVADEAYLRESILDPAAELVRGYDAVMPTFRGQLDEEEVLALIQYIKSLDGEARPADEQMATGAADQGEGKP